MSPGYLWQQKDMRREGGQLLVVIDDCLPCRL